jgi:entericidin B
MKSFWKKCFVVLAVLGAISFLSACNTVQGVGRDVEATGEAIEDAAD